MCTAITFSSLDKISYFGRTMDFSYEIQPHFYYVPANFEWYNTMMDRDLCNSYNFIGIGQELEDILGFFDGVNEHGFAAAALYFPGYVNYDEKTNNPSIIQIASYDFLHYILGSCASVDDLYDQMDHIRIIGVKDPLTQTVAPLHWIATDRSGRCVVLELTEKGLEIFDNQIGVLTNSPDFQWHMTNLRNYVQTSPQQVEESFWGQVQLMPFGQAGGTIPLPGGFTSPERFVRAAYLKSYVPIPDNSNHALSSFFQIMKSVSVPKGPVLTSRGTDDYTQYTAFINTDRCEYYFSTYDNLQLKRIRLSIPNIAYHEVIDLGEVMQPMI